ncbi:hypothetical protein pb186bvf_014407 [Paramecium bursaria]
MKYIKQIIIINYTQLYCQIIGLIYKLLSYQSIEQRQYQNPQSTLNQHETVAQLTLFYKVPPTQINNLVYKFQKKRIIIKNVLIKRQLKSFVSQDQSSLKSKFKFDLILKISQILTVISRKFYVLCTSKKQLDLLSMTQQSKNPQIQHKLLQPSNDTDCRHRIIQYNSLSILFLDISYIYIISLFE